MTVVVERDSVLKVVYQGLSVVSFSVSLLFLPELESKSGIATSPFKRSHLVIVPHMLIQLPHGLDRWSREPSAPLRLKHWRELEAWSIWWVSEAILARASLSVCLKHTAASQ